MHEEIKKKALKFLMTQKGGVVSTVMGDQPQSAFVYYDVDENFTIYFPTVVTTRKHNAIQENNKVAFNVTSIQPPYTVQIEGVIERVDDQVVTENAVANYIDIATHHMKHKAPLTKLDWEKGVVLYRIVPTWLRWSDYSDTTSGSGAPTSVVLIEQKHN